ncbi:MAG TPA: maleylacetoacetate isomerase, partial [Ramlibacter sp.]|nr:maleylacetoacetate isomerase [Ramlibacter sp.]
MKLYGYFRSSAAYRVRIALNLKGLSAEQVPVHLRKGEQRAPPYAARNPQKLVPALETDDGALLTQSLAIIEWLEEVHPQPPLLPSDPLDRARVRALALSIACDIHPVNNLRVLLHLRDALGQDQEARDDWYRHWIGVGFDGLEAMLADDPRSGTFCHGDTPT